MKTWADDLLRISATWSPNRADGAMFVRKRGNSHVHFRCPDCNLHMLELTSSHQGERASERFIRLQLTKMDRTKGLKTIMDTPVSRSL